MKLQSSTTFSISRLVLHRRGRLQPAGFARHHRSPSSSSSEPSSSSEMPPSCCVPTRRVSTNGGTDATIGARGVTWFPRSSSSPHRSIRAALGGSAGRDLGMPRGMFILDISGCAAQSSSRSWQLQHPQQFPVHSSSHSILQPLQVQLMPSAQGRQPSAAHACMRTK